MKVLRLIDIQSDGEARAIFHTHRWSDWSTNL